MLAVYTELDMERSRRKKQAKATSGEERVLFIMLVTDDSMAKKDHYSSFPTIGYYFK